MEPKYKKRHGIPIYTNTLQGTKTSLFKRYMEPVDPDTYK